uniref:Uncharacterized protein n=1 Tax=Castor canadensis TaxID=51338 RepID=A0A8C0WB49_CASCN
AGQPPRQPRFLRSRDLADQKHSALLSCAELQSTTCLPVGLPQHRTQSDVVVCACNPSYLGGRDRRIVNWRLA